MKQILLSLAFLFTLASQAAVPPRDEIAGNFVLLNYSTYDDATLYLKEMRDMQIVADPNSTNGIILKNFYITKGLSVQATYSSVNGNITIPSGAPLFAWNDGTGTVHYLYAWDERTGTATNRNIIYRYVGDGKWECSTPLVLMVGEDTSSLTPYTFSSVSVMHTANATSADKSFVYSLNYSTGELQVEFMYDESRPALVTQQGHSLSIYNLHTVSSYGYGCSIDLAYDDATGRLAGYPFLCGESPANLDYPYKAMAGTNLDATKNIPLGPSYEGTNWEGYITGTCDMEAGRIVIDPVSIYPVAYDNYTGQMRIEYRSVYETIKSFVVTFDPATVNTSVLPSSVTPPTVEGTPSTTVTQVRYYTLAGIETKKPQRGQVYIRRTTYADGHTKSEKILY